MRELFNLLVELHAAQSPPSIAGVEIAAPGDAGDRVLAWIDETFGGAWSSEAAAGRTIVASSAGEPIGFATVEARGPHYRWLNGLAREPGVGLFGPFGVAPAFRKRGIGTALLGRALSALRESGYERALIAAVGASLVQYYAGAAGAKIAERYDRDELLAPAPRTVVMASGNGSNFQAVAESVRDASLPLSLAALVCNNPRAYAIERARGTEVPARVVAWKRSEESRAAYDVRLLEAVKREEPDLVLLLGWMHLLALEFVSNFPSLLNLHPAFLPLDPAADAVVMPDGSRIPAFRGPAAVADALAAKSAWVGATVHRVTVATDRGPVLARRPMRVLEDEGEEAVMERLHRVEHSLVVSAVRRWLMERPAIDPSFTEVHP